MPWSYQHSKSFAWREDLGFERVGTCDRGQIRPRWIAADLSNLTDVRARNGDMSNSLHPVCLDPDALLDECDVHTSRRSGPGGQHRNKVETAVTLKHIASGIESEAAERRSRIENQRMAIKRLRINLALGLRRATARSSPSSLWRQRCRGGRTSVSTSHVDFPVLLAEALNVIETADFDVKAAAVRLACSSSQLVRFLKREPRAISQINAARLARGLHIMK